MLMIIFPTLQNLYYEIVPLLKFAATQNWASGIGQIGVWQAGYCKKSGRAIKVETESV